MDGEYGPHSSYNGESSRHQHAAASYNHLPSAAQQHPYANSDLTTQAYGHPYQYPMQQEMTPDYTMNHLSLREASNRAAVVNDFDINQVPTSPYGDSHPFLQDEGDGEQQVYPVSDPPIHYDTPIPEYTLPVDAVFPYRYEDQLVYKVLSEDQRYHIVEHIHEIRPYNADSIRKCLSRHLTPPLAKDFLSHDQDRADAATQVLIKANRPIKGGPRITWMNGLTNAQRRMVINKMAEATMESKDHLRILFLGLNVSPDVAKRILHASTAEQCYQIAVEHHLFWEFDPKEMPWHKGSSAQQRRALIHRLMTFGNVAKTSSIYNLLQKYAVPSGYGVEILRASDEEMVAIFSFLRGQTPQPLLQKRTYF
ncbi:hypothetical protein CBS101457_000168 [Exobasidium rhododendri]|nr:hypothetical protein CBS101457_000168 [Exobasidium rhododendri]